MKNWITLVYESFSKLKTYWSSFDIFSWDMLINFLKFKGIIFEFIRLLLEISILHYFKLYSVIDFNFSGMKLFMFALRVLLLIFND